VRKRDVKKVKNKKKSEGSESLRVGRSYGETRMDKRGKRCVSRLEAG
jgi:hypothetical protein